MIDNSIEMLAFGKCIKCTCNLDYQIFSNTEKAKDIGSTTAT